MDKRPLLSDDPITPIDVEDDNFDSEDSDDELHIDDTSYSSFRSFNVAAFIPVSGPSGVSSHHGDHAVGSVTASNDSIPDGMASGMSNGMGSGRSSASITPSPSMRSFSALPGFGELDESQSMMSFSRLPSVSKTSTIVLIIITSIMVLARSVDFVLYIRMSKVMQNYDYYLGSIWLSFAFLVISAPIAAYKVFWSKSVDAKQRAFPVKHFILMALLDSLGNILGTIPAPYVSGNINLAITQVIIPMNVVASMVFLRARYRWTHWLGLFVVMGGVTVTILPKFLDTSSSSSTAAGGGETSIYVLWIALLFISYIPQALSNIYKEKHLQRANLDVWYLNAWVAFFQLCFAFILIPIIFIPFPKPAPFIPPAKFLSYLRDAFLCTFGQNAQPTDLSCPEFPWIFLVFIAFNMTYNILILVVFQKGSSTLAVVASAARLVLSEIGFLIPFLAGEVVTKTLRPSDIVALAALIVGILIYQLQRETKKPKKRKQRSNPKLKVNEHK